MNESESREFVSKTLKFSLMFLAVPLEKTCLDESVYVDDIMKAYHGRHYHNVDHLKFMVDTARSHEVLSPELAFAILYHDYVYEIGATDNEELSNKKALDVARELSFRSNTIYHISCMILATKHPREKSEFEPYMKNMPPSRSDVSECMIIHDLDLMGFSLPLKLFLVNDLNVKNEYLTVVQEDVYEQGRKLFLKGLLDKPIYFHNRFSQYEEIARKNIQSVLDNEVERLEYVGVIGTFNSTPNITLTNERI